MFLQTGQTPHPEATPGFSGSGELYFWFFLFLSNLLWLAGVAFWVWMIIHCYRNDPDRVFWIIIMIFFWPSAIVYFFIRWLPGRQLRAPSGLKRFTRGKEIERLSIAAEQIGNAHQHVQLGDALLETGRYDRAGAAFARALEKEPDNLQALWGAAQVDMHLGEFPAAAERLKKVLGTDPQYKFGDVSLAYGKALYHRGDTDAAQKHLETHIHRWRHPEALFLLAAVEQENGNPHQARRHLLAMLQDINASPRAIARKFAPWKSKARKMLKKLPR